MLINELLQDVTQLATTCSSKQDNLSLLKLVLGNDSYTITALSRLRHSLRALRIPLLGHFLRVVQTAYFGIEIGKDVTLGHGVWFIHPLGIVIGGNAKIGNRVRFFGSNTVGTAKENGYPIIEDDVWVGAGARILGPIRVGAGSVIGANAVVLKDIPPNSVVVGVPGRVIRRKDDTLIEVL